MLRLFLLETALCALDFWLPLWGILSYVIAGALSLLAVPWALELFRKDHDRSPEPAPSPGKGAKAGGRALHLGTLLLMLAFVSAKWMVLLKAGETPADFVGSSRSYALAIWAVFSFGLVARGLRFGRLVGLAAEHPARMMALSFGITGVLGALVLSLPFSLETVRGVSLIDNLFTAFSAVCVTGLTVNNVAETYSLAGQGVLCALIQVGGLGIMVFSAAISLLSGRRMRVKSSAILAQMVDAASIASLRRTVVMILVYTVLIEGAGAAVLYADFVARPEVALRFGSELAGAGDPRWAAVFHAVSAFCNAGFSNLSSGLSALSGSPLVTLTVTALVVLGGIGFPVLDELFRALFTRLRGRRVPVHSLNARVSLRTAALLLGGMTLAYLVLEWGSSMAELSFGDRLTAALFQSASCRTAGFNVVDIGRMTPAVLLLTCAAMFVGAGPGSTGGGIKTTTLAVLLAGVRSELTGRPARLLNRVLPQAVIRRAISVAFLSMTLVALVFFLLLVLESQGPLDLAFEVVSAFSTTGLSTGVTPQLTGAGKVLITLTMFIGRIGPLTLALALARSAAARAVALPEEKVMIG